MAPKSPGVGAERRAAASHDELKKKVEAVGFKDVEVVPQMFVVIAKKPDGRGVSMIVDAETLQALQLGDDASDQDGDTPNAAPEDTCKDRRASRCKQRLSRPKSAAVLPSTL